MKKYLLYFLTSIFLMLFYNPLFSQASLAAENTIDDITVTVNKKQKVYTVFRDMIQPSQWYYMPNELRVAEEKTVNGKVKPKMTILKYQYQDVITKDNKEGGVLVASFTYTIEPEAIEQVKTQIRARKKGTTNITLSAIPLNSSSIDFLANSIEFIGNVDTKTFDGATSASQEMVLCFNLSVLGAGVFESLATGSGIPIRGNLKYNGLTAPCGYNITANWSQVYEYYEKLTKKELNLTLFNKQLGGRKSMEQKTETINTFKAMNVKVIECEAKTTPAKEGETSITDDGGLADIKSRIEAEVFDTSFMNRASELGRLTAMLATPIVQNDPATKEKLTKLKDILSIGLQAGWQKSIKNTNQRRTGTIVYDYSKQQRVIRETTIGGLLSFQKYGMTKQELIDNGHLIDIDINGIFPCVIIGLPTINPDYNLKSIVLEVGYKNSSGQTVYEARQWDAARNGWVTPMNKDVGHIRFNLIGENNLKRREEPVFKVKLQVISKTSNASFIIEKDIQLTRGDRYLDAIELLTQQFIIDGSSLDFSSVTNNPTDLAFAKLIFSKGAISINKDMKAYFQNGVAGVPNPVYVLLPNNNIPLSAKVIFNKSNGQKVERTEPIEMGENTLSNFEWKEIKN